MKQNSTNSSPLRGCHNAPAGQPVYRKKIIVAKKVPHCLRASPSASLMLAQKLQRWRMVADGSRYGEVR